MTDTKSQTGIKTILLVEDEAFIALAEKTILEKNSYHVIVAYNGEQAIESVEAGDAIDLVLMDINLGKGIDGTQTAQNILAIQDIPIVFLSSHTEPEVVEKTEAITSYGYIVKNTGETVLLASIKMAFRLFQAKQTVEENQKILLTMLEVSKHLVETVDLQTILQTSSDHLANLIGLNTGAIYLMYRDRIVLEASTPPLPEDVPDHFRDALLQDHPHIERAIKTAAPICVYDFESEELTATEREIVEGRSLCSVLYIPLISRGKPVGIFLAGATKPTEPVPESVINLCVTLSNIVAVALENAMLLAPVRE